MVTQLLILNIFYLLHLVFLEAMKWQTFLTSLYCSVRIFVREYSMRDHWESNQPNGNETPWCAQKRFPFHINGCLHLLWSKVIYFVFSFNKLLVTQKPYIRLLNSKSSKKTCFVPTVNYMSSAQTEINILLKGYTHGFFRYGYIRFLNTIV